MGSSSLSELWLACTSAVSLCWLAAEKEAASMMAVRPFIRFLKLEVSTWVNAAGFLDISFEMMLMALPRVSMESMSSASLDANSPASSSRMAVASPRSFVWVAMLPASSSILPSDTATSLVSLPMEASRSPFFDSPVVISLRLVLAASSHQLVYSTNAFCSASPSDATFAYSESRSSSTLPRGFWPSAAARAGSAPSASRAMRAAAWKVFIGVARLQRG
mmetsp:Transcript_53746/g.150156  ORF Transcript_53746/g.150156 Transcript_53746/m.150156 type:complete len:219 (+) Transcript_53746:134-790(+)